MPDASPNFSVSDNLGSLEDFNDSFKLDDDKGKQGGVRGWLDAGAKGEEGGVRGFGWEAGAKGEEEEEEEEAGGGCVARGYSLTPRRKRGEEEGGREEMHGINFVSREEEGKGEREGGGRRMGRSASGGKEEREGQITGASSNGASKHTTSIIRPVKPQPVAEGVAAGGVASGGVAWKSDSFRLGVGWHSKQESFKQARDKDDEEEEGAAGLLHEVSEVWERELRHQSTRFRSWHTRFDFSFVVLLLVLAMCIFSTVYPTRTLPDIQDMAPMIDFAGRRHYQLQVCAFLARELVLDDGFSRMTHEQLAGQLSLCLERLRVTYDAVRLGNAGQGVHNAIRVGADDRFSDHNQVMYTPGCSWREAETSGFEGSVENEFDAEHGCALEVFPDAGEKGLHYLAMTFFEVVEGILFDFGPPEDTWDKEPVVPADHLFTRVQIRDDRVRLAENNKDITFVTMMMEGDLFLGLDHIHEIFHHHTHEFLVEARHETEILYALYVILLAVGFYRIIFRGILNSTETDMVTIRQFVAHMPLHIMSPGEVRCICAVLVGEDEIRAHEIERAASASEVQTP